MRGSPSLFRPRGVLAVLLALAVYGSASAQIPQRTSSSWYASVLATYETGQRTDAVGAVLKADREAVIAAHREMFDGFDDALGRLRRTGDRRAPWSTVVRRARIRAARLSALLHTEALMRATNTEQRTTSLSLARGSIELLLGSRDEYHEEGPIADPAFARPQSGQVPAPGDAAHRRDGREWQAVERFCRQWFLTVIAWLHGTGNLEDALRAASRGLEVWKDNAELLLARGSVLETDAASLIVDRSLAARIYPAPRLRQWSNRLEQAADDLRRVHRVAPDSMEAMLRLGRARQLKRNLKDARAAYDSLRSREDLDPFVRYHALLFLGELEQEAGNRAAASDAYQQAVALMPVAQAPLLALSRLHDAAGDTAGARAWLRRSLLVVSPEREDPWWDYFKGQWRLLPARLEELRRMGNAHGADADGGK